MKRLTITLLALILILGAAVNASAFDVGGSLTSGTDLSTLDIEGASTEAQLGLWLESGKGEHYSFEMKFDLTAAITKDLLEDEVLFNFYFNPDYLKLDGLWDDLDYGPSILATSFGRFSASDFSSKVFSQQLDGLTMNFNYPKAELTITAGTTALMFTESGSILNSSSPTIMSKTDLAQTSNSTTLTKKLFDPDGTDGLTIFDSPRAVEIITLSLPEAIARQSLTFSLVAQEDLRPMMAVAADYFGETTDYPLVQEGDIYYDADGGGAVDTQYIGAGVSGPIIGSLYHNVFYYFGTGRTLSYKADGNSSEGYSYQYDTIISHMAGFSLDYFLPWLFNSRISGGAYFGTGDSDADYYYEGNKEGYYTQFTPITSGGGGIIFSPGVSNILTANASYSMKPLGWMPLRIVKDLQVSANLLQFYRLTEGPVSISGISSDFEAESRNYLGSEIDLTVNWRPFSDLGAIAQVGYFLPNSNAFEAGSDMSNPTFMAKLNVSFSF
ncbi:MAG: hypothetical protein PQJ61_11395 [Spirochaetales bacterium]|uniref:Alginate export domain-containing protein n=1 Tax=Candidatus Thalassospirochaeta sargassi TaxID=3119039 RepID=A0AAJ1ML10_9SPIO|nr:hypothetical protein [Spirochaetales bacterium]